MIIMAIDSQAISPNDMTEVNRNVTMAKIHLIRETILQHFCSNSILRSMPDTPAENQMTKVD